VDSTWQVQVILLEVTRSNHSNVKVGVSCTLLSASYLSYLTGQLFPCVIMRLWHSLDLGSRVLDQDWQGSGWRMGINLPPYCTYMESFCCPLYLSSFHIQMDTLGHTLTPFCSVCRQFLGFIPDDAHVLQISSDNVHPVFPWPSQLPLIAPQFPLYSLTRYSGVLHP